MGRLCCPLPEQDSAFESKSNSFCPFTRNRNYLKMYPLLWLPREDLLPYLPFDLSHSSCYCFPHFQTPSGIQTFLHSFSLPWISLQPLYPFFFFFSPLATRFPNSSRMYFTNFTRFFTVLTSPCPLWSFLTGLLHVNVKISRRWQLPYRRTQVCFHGKCNKNSAPNC